MPIQQTINIQNIQNKDFSILGVNLFFTQQSNGDSISYTEQNSEIELTQTQININSTFGSELPITGNIQLKILYNGNECLLPAQQFNANFVPATTILTYDFESLDRSNFISNDNITNEFNNNFELSLIENPNGLTKIPQPESGVGDATELMGFSDANNRFDSIVFSSITNYKDDKTTQATAIESDFPPTNSNGIGTGNLTTAQRLMSSQISFGTTSYRYSDTWTAAHIPPYGTYNYIGDFGVPTSITGYMMIGYNQGIRFSSYTCSIEDINIEGSNDNSTYVLLPSLKPSSISYNSSAGQNHVRYLLKVNGTTPYRYYKVSYTGRFFQAGFQGAFLTPLPSYDTSKINFITTSNSSQVNISSNNLLKITLNQTTNIETKIYYMFSFDNRNNWGVFTNENTFEVKTNDLNNYNWSLQGNSMQDLDFLTTSFNIDSFNTLDFAVGLSSNNRNSTPSLDQLILTLN